MKYLTILIIPLFYVLLSSHFPALGLRLKHSTRPEQAPAEKDPKKKLKTVMQPPRPDLAPPKDDPFTTEQLKQFDGTDPTKPIYVAIKGCNRTTTSIQALISLIKPPSSMSRPKPRSMEQGSPTMFLLGRMGQGVLGCQV